MSYHQTKAMLLKALHLTLIRYPQSIVAGGAIRDLLIGRPIRDIDIFTIDTIPDEDKMLPPDMDYADTGGRIIAVTNPFTVPTIDYPVQIVQLNEGDVRDGVPRFCFGLSQAYMNDDGDIVVDDPFTSDLVNRTMTVTWCTSDIEARHILRKWESLSKKYADYTLVIPSEMQVHFPEPKDL